MIFNFKIHSPDNPSLTATVVLLIFGRFLDPPALAIIINGLDRRAQWSGDELVFDECLEVSFGPQSSSLLYRLELEDMPASLAETLNALVDAGVETAVTKCDLCDAMAPACLISACTLCVCPGCRERRLSTAS